MKIGLGKFGKSTVFGNINSLRKSMTSGAIDAPTIYRAIIDHNPQHEFYLIGKNDYARLKPAERDELNKHGNVFDPWDGFKSTPKSDLQKTEHIDWLDNWRQTSGVELDVGIFLPGHMLPIGVEGKTIGKNGELAKCLFASCVYAGPMYHYVNMTNLPYVMLLTDPRTYRDGLNEDLFYAPKLVLSQYDETIDISHRVRYDTLEMVKESVPAKYSGIETLYLIERGIAQREETSLETFFDQPERDIRMLLFLNEGNPSRYEDVMQYVLGEDNDIKVYGKWNEKIYAKDSRFEDVPMAEMADDFKRIKYTFCIPIKKGWATGKFWDMARMGIIPFVHPDYDSQRHIGFPEFLRIESAEDLKKKMDFLDDNPDEYQKMLSTIGDMMTPDMRSGKYISDMVMKAVEEIL